MFVQYVSLNETLKVSTLDVYVFYASPEKDVCAFNGPLVSYRLFVIS